MTYEGNGYYTFYSCLGHKIKLSEDDINSILKEYFSTLEDNERKKLIGELIDKDTKEFLNKIDNKKILNDEFIQYKINSHIRRYHPKEHIMKLFQSYYDKTNIELNTKTKVFIKIANELKITPKAVNKAYYSK